jgi:hypothetical protein
VLPPLQITVGEAVYNVGAIDGSLTDMLIPVAGPAALIAQGAPVELSALR